MAKKKPSQQLLLKSVQYVHDPNAAMLWIDMYSELLLKHLKSKINDS